MVRRPPITLPGANCEDRNVATVAFQNQGDGKQSYIGPTGATGPEGPAGPQGEQGPQGDVGPAGPPGADGADGVDGVDGTDGADGAPGAPGAAGVGVPAGGTTGQLLAKNSNTNYDDHWIDPPSAGVWGSITGILSAQTDLQTALNAKQNSITTGTTAQYFRGDLSLATFPTISGTNTGDQTSIVGITGTKAQFNTACTDGDFLYVGDVVSYTDEAAQDAIGAMIDGTLVYVDATPLLTRAALTGDVTASQGSNATTIAASAVTLAKMANVATASVFYRKTAGTGAPEVQTLATLKTDLGLTGTNSGDQTITLTGNVTGSGTGSFATTIAAGVVTLAMQANMATASLVYRKTAGAGAPEVNTLATLKTDLGLTGTNSGDQTTIVGITGTKAQFDTACTDGNFLYVGDVVSYTDEAAQDAVGLMIDTTLVYVDATPLLTRAALTGDVTASQGSNATTIANSAVTLAKMADVATASVFYRKTAATGAPEVQTLATLKTDLGLTGTNSGDQTITLTGNVTGSGTGSFATTIAAGVVTLAMQANMATASVVYRKTAGSGAPEVNTLATLKTDLGLTGTNSGDQTITLTSDVTGSGTGSFATTIAASAVTLAKMADVVTASVFYRKTAGTGAPEVNTLATLKTDLGLTGTNSGDQTITLTGNVTGSGTGSFATTIAAGVVTLAMQANMATASVVYRKTAGSGAPEVNTLATLKTDLGLTGTNSGDQTITLTSDVTGSGTGSFATTIAASAVTLAKMANVATGTVFYRTTAGTGAPEVQTLATLKTDLGLTGTNSGDQTITLTGDVTGSGTGSFVTAIGSGVIVNADVNASAAIDISKLGTSTTQALGVGSVELGHATDTTLARVSAGVVSIEGVTILTTATGQPLDSDLTTIAGLTATTDNFLQAKASAWASRTPTQVTADLVVMVGDAGAGGTKGLVPTPTVGASTKFLRGDATWQAIPGGGDALTSGNLSQFAATTSLQLKNTISDETGSGALVFATLPTFDSLNLVTTSSSSLGIIFQNSTRLMHSYGTGNLFFGVSAGNFTLTGDANLGLGFAALAGLTSGITNTAFGKQALTSLTGGSGNIAVGARAMAVTTTASNSIAIGTNALENNNGDGNLGIGANALNANLTGAINLAIGGSSQQLGTAGNYNVSIGDSSLKNSTSDANVAIGLQCLISVTSGNSNVGIGFQTGYTDTGANALTTGSNNTYLGTKAGQASTTQRDYLICLGYKALGDSSNLCVIGGTTAAGTAVDLVMGATTASAKAHFIKTTEQLRLGYDTSNYFSTTVSSTGSATFNLTGTAPVFNFSKDISLPADVGVNLTIASAEPSTPAANVIRVYSRAVGGRVMLKWKDENGSDKIVQPSLFANSFLMYIPLNSTTGTGAGSALGPAWTPGGTVTHPTPSNTSPALSNQMKRTRFANVVTTTNQELGVRMNAVTERQFWRGDSAGRGGFFFFTRFIVELYPASTVRIFAGLTGNTSTGIVISNTVLNDTCGLWHDTTDPSSGANSFNFVTRDAATTTKQSIALTNAIAAGNSYDFYMFAPPGSGNIWWKLDDIVNGVSYTGFSSTTLPTSSVFMQPQVEMSNGTANVTVTTSAIGVAQVYVESPR